MSRYQVVLTKTAEKNLSKLPVKVIEHLVQIIRSLELDPRPHGCKKLKGYKNLWRIRYGNYRIIYAIDDIILLVDVREIGHRKDVYDVI
jgi:mRNA interferase RelE/StbE